VGSVKGWANARFLASNPYPSPQTPPEAELKCGGAEPFWSLELTPYVFRLAVAAGETRTWSRSPVESAAGRYDLWVVEATGKSEHAHGVCDF
jgi:hypothetical protein